MNVIPNRKTGYALNNGKSYNGYGVGEMINQEAFAALNADFMNQTKCREWILNKLHPAGAFCPGCGGSLDDAVRIKNFYNGDRLSCSICGKYFTALTGTPFSGAHLDFKGLFLLAALAGCGIPDKIIAEKLKITLQSARTWRIKLKTMPLLSG